MTQSPSRAQAGSLVTSARYALIALAFLFGIGAVVQIFLAGLSLFESAEYWVDHVDLGRYLGIPALLIPIAAFLGRVSRQGIVMSITVTVLFVLQMVLANVDNGFIGAFHALNAFAVTGVAFQAGFRALALVRAPSTDSGVRGVVQGGVD